MFYYSGAQRSITPNTGDDNWSLDAVSAGVGKLLEVSWGGEATSSTAMATRVARSNGESGAITSGNPSEHGPANQPANQIDFVAANGYAATQPTLNSADLLALSWNCHGGIVRWVFHIVYEIWLVTGESLDIISCRNTVGTGTSTYGCAWSEIGV